MPILTISGCQKITLVLEAPELRARFCSFVNRVVQRDIITFLCALISLGTWIILGFDFQSVDHTGIHSQSVVTALWIIAFKLSIFLQFTSLPSKYTERSIWKTIMNNMHNLRYGLQSLSGQIWFHPGPTGRLRDGNIYDN